MTETTHLEIKTVGTERLLVPVVGTAPLIVNRWSEKAKRELLESQQGKKKIKTPLDPQAEYEASYYRIEVDDQPMGYGSPRWRSSRPPSTPSGSSTNRSPKSASNSPYTSGASSLNPNP